MLHHVKHYKKTQGASSIEQILLMHCGPRRKRRRKQRGGILPLLIPAAVAAAVLMKRKKKKKVGKISAAHMAANRRRVQRMFAGMPGWGGFKTLKRL